MSPHRVWWEIKIEYWKYFDLEADEFIRLFNLEYYYQHKKIYKTKRLMTKYLSENSWRMDCSFITAWRDRVDWITYFGESYD